MHHKFFVFCDVGLDDKYRMPCSITPRSVWTGSFNPTANGTRSRENAVLIESDGIAAAYAREWFQVYAISEPLDWESDWCAPEYRIGT
jgi:phosphatidylserine/phosphatidylglycerophosphate/cardiolipin synthase-like enzyme